MVTMPPLVVRMRASSTVLVKASSFVNLDLAGIVRRRLCLEGQGEIWKEKKRKSCRETLRRPVVTSSRPTECLADDDLTGPMPSR